MQEEYQEDLLDEAIFAHILRPAEFFEYAPTQEEVDKDDDKFDVYKNHKD